MGRLGLLNPGIKINIWEECKAALEVAFQGGVRLFYTDSLSGRFGTVTIANGGVNTNVAGTSSSGGRVNANSYGLTHCTFLLSD